MPTLVASAPTVVSTAAFHPVPLVVVALVAAWYLRQLVRAGEWPAWRSACFAGGLVLVGVVTAAGLDGADRGGFALPVVSQLFLFLIAPALLAFGSPIALGVRAGSAGARRIARGATGRAARVALHPLAAWAVFGVLLFLLYFTGQYRAATEHAWALDLTGLELVAVGLLLVGPLAGTDPRPATPAGWQLAHTFLGVLYFSVLGMALESQHRDLAPDITPASVHAGAGDMWSAAELLSIAALIGVLLRWVVADHGRAERANRLTAEEDARQLAAWRASRREAGLADLRATASVVVRSRPAGTGRDERSFATARVAAPAGATGTADAADAPGGATGVEPGRPARAELGGSRDAGAIATGAHRRTTTEPGEPGDR